MASRASQSVHALEGLKVIDMATIFAGPGAARHLADFGADVIKVEAPGGDGTRRMTWFPPEGGDSYAWKVVARNKRCVTLDLKTPAGHDALLALVQHADVLIENNRPGALERLGIGPDVLLACNPRLVILRVSGFGQTGPYSGKAGFATTAEAMSGFAAINGEPGGAPLVPPVALTDEVTAVVGAFAIMVALRHSERTGVGQVIDCNLLESAIQMMGPLPSAAAHLGYDQPRLGSGIPYSVPRGTFECSDGRWVAVSASAESVATRVVELVGLGDDPRFSTFEGRVANRDELQGTVSNWIAARTFDDVIATFENAQAAIGPVLTMRELLKDPHVVERSIFVDVDGVTMPGPIVRMSVTPGELEFAGRGENADSAEILRDLLGAWKPDTH